MNTEDKSSFARSHSRGREMLAVGVFVAVSLFAPVVVGEMYPFTISPMFCDQPGHYCTYQLTDEEDNLLDLELFGLHLVYDGNPPGLGMGVEAAPRLHEFGEVPAIEAVANHVLNKVDAANLDLKTIRIRQTVVCCNGTCPEKEVRETVLSIDNSRHWTAN